jgi:hypothetical protein
VAAALYVALKNWTAFDYIEKKTTGINTREATFDSGDDAIVTDYGAGTDFSFENIYGDFTIRSGCPRGALLRDPGRRRGGRDLGRRIRRRIRRHVGLFPASLLTATAR